MEYYEKAYFFLFYDKFVLTYLHTVLNCVGISPEFRYSRRLIPAVFNLTLTKVPLRPKAVTAVLGILRLT